MSEAQSWRIQELEREVELLKDQVTELRSFQDRLMGMSDLSKWGIKLAFLVAGAGGVDIAIRVFHWLQGPMK